MGGVEGCKGTSPLLFKGSDLGGSAKHGFLTARLAIPRRYRVHVTDFNATESRRQFVR